MLRTLLQRLFGVVACIGILQATCGLAVAQASPTLPSVTVGQASLVTPSNALTYYQGIDGLTSNPRTTDPDPDITALATALRHDPDTIYRWVHDNVDLDLTFGLGKGGRGAAIDKAGTPFDQAHLMVELLRASGYTASYAFGTITLTGAQFTAWTGISDYNSAQQILGDGGIPATVSGSGTTITSVTMLHCWVLATIGGTAYAFDPSMKTYNITSGIGSSQILTAMNFTGSTFLSDALSGSTSDTSLGPARIRAPNYTNVDNDMQGYSQNLLTYIRNNLPNGDIDDVIGGKHIVPIAAATYTPLRQTSLPYQTTIYETFANDIPNSLRTKLTITLDTYTFTDYFDHFYGDLLSIALVENGGWRWQVFADKTMLWQSSGTATFSGTSSLTINHPYAADSGSYMTRTITTPDTLSGGGMIVYGLGTVGADLAKRFALREGDGTQTFTQKCEGSGENVSCNNFAAPLGDANLVKAISSWLVQYSRMADIYQKVAGGFVQTHDMLGTAAVIYNEASASSGFHDSLKFNVETGLSFESLNSSNTTIRPAALAGLISAANTLEGSVSEQTSGTMDPVSVAAKFDWLARAGVTSGTDWIYYAKPSNWSTVQAQLLSDYGTQNSPSMTSVVEPQAQTYINSGFNVIIPISSNLGPGEYQFLDVPPPQPVTFMGLERGGAMIAFKPDLSQVGYVVVRNGTTDKGGGGSSPVNADPSTMFSPDTNFIEQQTKTRQKFYSVDLQTGDLTYTPPPDIVAGNGKFPYSLSFQRVFRSTGNGWTNNLMSSLHISGNGLASMGPTSLGAAETIALVETQLYLAPLSQTTDMATLQNHVVAALTNMWWAERLAVNNVTLTMDNTEKSFTRLADNSYFAPGDPSILSGPVTRSFGPDPYVGGWYTQPASWLPIETLAPNIMGIRGTSAPPPSDNCTGGTVLSQFRFTLTDKGGSIANFDYICNNVHIQTAPGEGVSEHDYRMTSRTWPTGISVTYTFDGNNMPTGVSNSLGRRINYGTSGQPYPYYTTQTVTDPNSGRSVTINGGFCDSDYNDLSVAASVCVGQINQVTDAMGLVTTYSYVSGTGTTSVGSMNLGSLVAQPPLQLQSVSLPGSSPNLTFAYDNDERVTSITDALAYVWNFHIANGRRGETVDPITPVPDYATTLYNDRLRAYTTIDGLGYVSMATFDGQGRVLSKTNPLGDAESYAYDVRSNILTTTDTPMQGSSLSPITTTLTYNEGPTVIVCNNPASCNEPGTWKNGNGNTTTYVWNGDGSLHSVTLPPDSNGNQPVTVFGYTQYAGTFNLLTSKQQYVTTNAYVQTNYAYNASNFYVPQSLELDPGGLQLTTSFTFDSAGNIGSETDPRGNTSNFVWDNDRRPVFSIQPSPGGSAPRPATKLSYTPDSYLSEVDRGTTTTPTGSDFSGIESILYSYDAADDKVVESKGGTGINPAASQTQYSYDAAGRLQCTAVRMNPTVYYSTSTSACALQGQGNYGPDRVTEVGYDADGHVLTESRAVNTSLQEIYATYTYTADGKESSVYDADGSTHITNYAYDGFDRLKTTTFADNTTEQLGYDNDNNITSRENRANQTINYVFDNLNRIITKSVPAVGSISANTVSWTYDLKNEIERLSDTLGNTLAYNYDNAGRVTLAARYVPTLSGSQSVNYGYDNNGNLTQLTWPDNYYVIYQYDALNHVTSAIENNTTTLASYGYDQLGRRASVTYANGASVSLSWSPDDDLLTLGDSFPNTTNNITYTDAYTPAHQITTSTISNPLFRFGALQNLTSNYGTVDSLNEYPSVTPAGGSPTSIAYDNNGNLTTDGTWSFGYDPENHLMTATGTGTSASYAYDPLGRRTAKTVNGTVTNFLDDTKGNEIAEYDGSGNLLRRYVPGSAVNDPVAEVTASGTHTYFHTDKIGSISAMSDINGNLAEGPYTYDAYGNCIISSGACGAGVPFLFAGMRLDPETGLYYDRARYYSASLGRFLQADPVGYKTDLNAYSYVQDDPLNMLDPTGLMTIDVSGCASSDGDCQSAGKALTARNAELTKKINGLSNNQKIKMRDGSVLTGAQLKNVWNNTTLKLVSGQNFDKVNGGAGENDSTFKNGNFESAIVTMNGDQAWGYVGHGIAEQNFLLFHEVGHDTPEGNEARYATYAHYQASPGGRPWGPGNPDWERNETTANDAARSIAGALAPPEPIANPTATTFSPD